MRRSDRKHVGILPSVNSTRGEFTLVNAHLLKWGKAGICVFPNCPGFAICLGGMHLVSYHLIGAAQLKLCQRVVDWVRCH